MTPAEELEQLHKEFHALNMHIRYGDRRCPVCLSWRNNVRRLK